MATRSKMRAAASAPPTKEPPIFVDGMDANSPLSNLCASLFTHMDVCYTSLEQWHYSCKAKFYQDERTEGFIMASQSPKILSTYLIHYGPVDPTAWDAGPHQWHTMMMGASLKFERSNQAQVLRSRLLATGNREIFYVTPDRYLGIGLEKQDVAGHTGEWPGKNKMGEILMRQRATLRGTLTKE